MTRKQTAKRRALLLRLLRERAATTPENLRLLLEAHGFLSTPRDVLRDLRALRRRDLRTLRAHEQRRARLQELWRSFSAPLVPGERGPPKTPRRRTPEIPCPPG